MRWIFLSMVIFISLPAWGRPPKGFHTGPYLQIVGGAVNASFDKNLVSATQTARNQEMAFGFVFGWHVNDHFGPFLEGRYSTDLNNGNTLHMVNVNIGGTYTLILDALSDFKTLRILPFLGASGIMHVDALPSDPSVGSGTVDRYGAGVGISGGVNFLFKRYVYLGIMGQEDFLYFLERSQTIAGVDTAVYPGGWHPQWGASLLAGVHF